MKVKVKENKVCRMRYVQFIEKNDLSYNLVKDIHNYFLLIKIGDLVESNQANLKKYLKDIVLPEIPLYLFTKDLNSNLFNKIIQNNLIAKSLNKIRKEGLENILLTFARELKSDNLLEDSEEVGYTDKEILEMQSNKIILSNEEIEKFSKSKKYII